jgi:bacillithiol disulfide reductase
MFDLIIIGSGPAGLSAALAAKRCALDCLVIERGVIADTIYHYPIAKPLFSTANEIELEPGALRSDGKPTREETLAHYRDVIKREQLKINANEEARDITVFDGGFLVETNAGRRQTRSLLLAIGGFGCQRKLGVRGEDSTRVSYQFSEAHPYANKRALVVGGGNSAAEAAIFLEDAGADVTYSIRRSSLDASIEGAGAKIKPWVQEPLERLESEGRIEIIRSSRVVEIYSESALLEVAGNNATDVIEVSCDHIFALIGADPDMDLLRKAGAQIASDGRPVYSDDYETTIPGLYVAGHVTREMHMKNAIEVGRKVACHIASKIRKQSLAFCD